MIQHEDLVIDIDNGSERILVTLKDRKAVNATPGISNIPLAHQYESHKTEHIPSPQIIREKNDEALEEIGKEERIARLLSLLFADTKSKRVPGVALSYNPELTEIIKQAAGYEESNVSPVDIPRENDEHFVAGQPCDIISASNMHSRLWYWGEMHHYPGKLERPILLKTEVTNQKEEIIGTEQAIKFAVLSEIASTVFELDTSLQ